MQYSSLESLSLPRRQRVFDTQLVPDGDPLPIWRKLPLDSKLPVVPSPKGSYTLYTTQMGVPKYIHKQHYDFDLGNALYARPAEYDSLHDPFLKEHHYKPRNKQLLVRNDLITTDCKVKCDIKEFNQYRSYLRYRSVTELSLQRSKDRVEDSWLPREARSELPRDKPPSIHSRVPSERDDGSHQMPLPGHDVSLVQRMHAREQTLVKKMSDKQRQRQRDYERKLKESWQSRKQRQQRLLQQEEEIDRKFREERARQIVHREKTLARQRNRMVAKLGRSTDGLDIGHVTDRHAQDERAKERRRDVERKQRKSSEEEERGEGEGGEGDHRSDEERDEEGPVENA